MKIDQLIEILQRVKEAKGNVEVIASGFLGTNQGFVTLDIKSPSNGRKNFKVDDQLNDYNQFCIGVEISDHTRKEIEAAVKDMKAKGYRYFLSQYCSWTERRKKVCRLVSGIIRGKELDFL